jgi:hypothetical protein
MAKQGSGNLTGLWVVESFDDVMLVGGRSWDLPIPCLGYFIKTMMSEHEGGWMYPDEYAVSLSGYCATWVTPDMQKRYGYFTEQPRFAIMPLPPRVETLIVFDGGFSFTGVSPSCKSERHASNQ